MENENKRNANEQNTKCVTYFDFDVKLGSDVFRRFFRLFRVCDRRSLYDSERFTDTGADFDFALQIKRIISTTC